MNKVLNTAFAMTAIAASQTGITMHANELNVDTNKTINGVKDTLNEQIEDPEDINDRGAQSGKTISEIFPDRALALSMQEKLGKLTVEETVSQEELDEIKVLMINNRGIHDLTGIDQVHNVRILFIQSNDVNDLRPLATLDNLSVLNVAQNNVTDVKALQTIETLTDLNISYNNITDIRPLTNLHNVESITMNGNAISDITPVFQMESLQSVSAYRQTMTPKSMAYDKKLTVNLETLLNLNNLTDIDYKLEVNSDVAHKLNSERPLVSFEQVADKQLLDYNVTLEYAGDAGSNKIVHYSVNVHQPLYVKAVHKKQVVPKKSTLDIVEQNNNEDVIAMNTSKGRQEVFHGAFILQMFVLATGIVIGSLGIITQKLFR